MLSVSEAEARVAALIERARRAGADAADALYYADASSGVQVRLGALEDVARSEGEEIGLRFFLGHRSASVSSSDLSEEALAALVDRAAAMAREAPEDPYAGLAPDERLMTGATPDLDSDDGRDLPAAELKALRAGDRGFGAFGGGRDQQRGRRRQCRPHHRRARHQPRLLPRLYDLVLWWLGKRHRRNRRRHAARLCPSRRAPL